MAVYDNLNKTYSPGVAPGIIEYYERTLLENAKPELVHARDSQKRSLPPNNGKHVNFRRFTPFAAVTEPLKEGVTPDGQTLVQTTFSAMVKPYGAHVEITDELDWYHLDNIHRETARLLSDQALLTIDTVTRDPLHAGLNVQYVSKSGTPTNRAAITNNDILTSDEIKKAVRTLKRNNCKPFSDGFYHAIVHPDTVYDLASDPLWIDVAKYQDKSKIEKYELGTMYKVKFFESTNAKSFTTEQYVFGQKASLTMTAYDKDSKTVTISDALTEDEARELTGKLVYLYDASETTNYPVCIERVYVSEKKIKLRYAPSGYTAYASGDLIKPSGGGASGIRVLSTLVYGADAFGTISLGGNGDNVEIIMNPPGSSGSADPLNQRGTIAWKVKGFCSTILQDDFIVRIEHGATA